MNFLLRQAFHRTSQLGPSPRFLRKKLALFLSSTAIRTLIFSWSEEDRKHCWKPRSSLVDEKPWSMQIHGRSAFSKFVAPRPAFCIRLPEGSIWSVSEYQDQVPLFFSLDPKPYLGSSYRSMTHLELPCIVFFCAVPAQVAQEGFCCAIIFA